MSIRMAPSKKRVVKKTTTRKTTTKKAPKKAPKKTATKKKAPAKKAPTNKAPAKKAPAKTKKAPAKKAPVKAKKALIKKTPVTRRGDGPAWVTPFLSALPPVDAETPDAERLEALAERVPPPLMEAWRSVGWGRFGEGFVVLVDPQELEDVLDEWLGGPSATRVPLGRTALGDLLYFRDLRERARQLGFTGDVADNACDVNVVDVRYKRVSRLSTSVADFFSSVLGNVDELEATMRKDLFDAALPRLGQPARHEMYGFVPALALGGSENPESLQRVRAREHLSLLFQL